MSLRSIDRLPLLLFAVFAVSLAATCATGDAGDALRTSLPESLTWPPLPHSPWPFKPERLAPAFVDHWDEDAPVSQQLRATLGKVLDALYSTDPGQRGDAVHALRQLASHMLRRPRRRPHRVRRTYAARPVIDAESEAVLGDAAFTLGALAASGIAPRLVPQDVRLARSLYKTAARAGSVPASFARAYQFYQGFAAPRSCPAVYHHLQLPSRVISEELEVAGIQQVPLGPVLLRARWRDAGFVSNASLLRSPDQVAFETNQAAFGDADAIEHLAYREHLGLGTEQNPARARERFEQVARGGNPMGMVNLGFMYLQGLGGPVNATAARLLFEAAARKDSGIAYNGLGFIYYHGYGVEQNVTRARELWQRGSDLGDAQSKFNLAALLITGTRGSRQRGDIQRAYYYLQDADSKGHWKAPLLLSILLFEYAETPGGPRCSDAVSLLWRFARDCSNWMDDAQAAYEVLLAGRQESFVGGQVPLVTEPAVAWPALLSYTLLAEQGLEEASMNAAWLLERGAGLDTGSTGGPAAEYFHMRSALLRRPDALVDYADWLLGVHREGEQASEAAAALVSDPSAVEGSDVVTGTPVPPSNGASKRGEHGQAGGLQAGMAEASGGAQTPPAGGGSDTVEGRMGEPHSSFRRRLLERVWGRGGGAALRKARLLLQHGRRARDAEATTGLAWLAYTGLGVPPSAADARSLLLEAVKFAPAHAEAFAARVMLLCLDASEAVRAVLPGAVLALLAQAWQMGLLTASGVLGRCEVWYKGVLGQLKGLLDGLFELPGAAAAEVSMVTLLQHSQLQGRPSWPTAVTPGVPSGSGVCTGLQARALSSTGVCVRMLRLSGQEAVLGGGRVDNLNPLEAMLIAGLVTLVVLRLLRAVLPLCQPDRVQVCRGRRR